MIAQVWRELLGRGEGFVGDDADLLRLTCRHHLIRHPGARRDPIPMHSESACVSSVQRTLGSRLRGSDNS